MVSGGESGICDKSNLVGISRTVKITVLVAAGVRFTLPVSCVEQGRWRGEEVLRQARLGV
jgi:hypothetical protein